MAVRARVVGLLVLVGLVLVGCMKPDRRGAPLELGDARLDIVQADGARHVVSLAADGTLAWDGATFATITRDGQLMVGGKQTARIEKDGVLWADGAPSNVVIQPGGTISMSGLEELRLDDQNQASGRLMETLDDARVKLAGAKVTYVGPPTARRALMTGFIAWLTRTPLETPSVKTTR